MRVFGGQIFMSARIGRAFHYFTASLLIYAALMYSPALSAQTVSLEKTHEGQTSSDPTSESEQAPSTQPVICGPAHLVRCLNDIASDQAGIWTSPFRLHTKDALWLLPFAGATAVAIHYDARAQQELGVDKSRIDTSNAISQLGATYTIGRVTHNDHLAETGRLGAEAIIDATLVSEAIKLVANRERPDEGNGTGGFWPHGTRSHSDSFPSGRAIESWAFARVIASEYPNKLTQVGVYTFATAISISRVTSRRHFPSDALVGSVFGYLIGGYVIHHRSAESTGLGFSIVPMVDVSTHTFGAGITLRPDELNLPNFGRTVKRLRPNW